jgi:AraC-like DNA-binding protein
MEIRRPAIASGAFKKLTTALTVLGLDARAIYAEARFDPSICDDPDARVPLAKLHDLWDVVIRHTGRADAALQGAQNYAPGDYGLVGFVAMNCATLYEALQHVVRYMSLWTDDPGIRAHDDGLIEVEYRTSFADRPGVRCATEAALAEILHGARLLTQGTLAPAHVTFTHEGPSDPSAYERFFGAPVRFLQPHTAMQMTKAQLQLALPKADAQLGAFLRGMANEALARHRGVQESPLDQIRSMIADELHKGVPSLDAIAHRMATSERTLRRRLEQEGTSFRHLLDDTRSAIARSYVRDRRMPLSEVAFLLGFSEPSAFHRAFKRWTDTTPRAWRERGA